ncbi:uncharacterized protein TRIREDRAFT_111253 [Trichoderma reesei QM6a]|jgi:hypothetical protein|uniref:Predicted protein n=2 Tax=Hypocrea jecorina TaxID=51453 RepID=G0RTY4_HYPJQ|nr:uncharacterized protein TRIREDRAFT_111253 [Trichoderma reesei QM6a]EGR45288.1 predicted protein [Trichoderma reesei QM6a]
MEHSRSNNRQLAVPQAPTTSATQPSQLRHRLSFRDRFWTRTSANYDGEDDVIHESQPNPVKKSPYVPQNAASGFSRTSSSLREQSRRTLRPDKPSPSSKHDTSFNPYAPSPFRDHLAPGHLYVHTETGSDEPEPEHEHEAASSSSQTGRDTTSSTTTTDFAAFIAAAQSEERVRRAASQTQGGAARSSQYRDSGYYSSSNGGGGGRHDSDLERRPYSPSLPSSAGVARAKGQQQSGRSFGQRIAEYIKPPRDEAVAAMRR